MENLFRKAAKTVVLQCLNVKKTETTLILTDILEREIGLTIYDVAKEYAFEAIFIEISSRETHGEEPPKAVSAAMLETDVIIAPTFRSITHTEARRNACNNGARVASMPGILRETFLRAMITNYSIIAEKTIKISEALSQAKLARIISDHGTDIVINLENRQAFADTGLIHNPGDYGNLPAGEASISPLEGSANGTIIIDGSIGDTGVLDSNDYITIKVKDGFATEITGTRAAGYLSGLLAQFPNEARNIAEFGIGTNPSARLCGNILEDEKIMGTVSIALGNNVSLGGSIEVPIHLDAIILSPTIWLDGKRIINRGKLIL